MCELLGMTFDKPVRPDFSFRGFRHRSRENPDGWGIAFYPGGRLQVIKEPKPALESEISEFVRDYPGVESNTIIAHVRNASAGDNCYANTHPFYRQMNGNEYAFAHNGTLKNFRSLQTGRFAPIGATDSEHVFCHILSWVEFEGEQSWPKEKIERLKACFLNINQYGSFNCLFSDGKMLFCYRDRNGEKPLSYVQRKKPFSRAALKDEDFEISLQGSEEQGYIIASRPLTDESWIEFESGSLLVFRKGTLLRH